MRRYNRKTRLHKLLDKVRMTQKMFASHIGVEPSAVSLWFSGKRLPMGDSINRMAYILQVEPLRLKAMFIAENLLEEHGLEVFDELSDEMTRILGEECEA